MNNIIIKKHFFPWRLFWKFFFSLILLLNFMSIFSVFLVTSYYGGDFFSAEKIVFSVCFLFLSIVGSLIFSYRFALPMRRVILKALRMANKRLFMEISGNTEVALSADLDSESLFESEPGEYFELEQALDQIRKKLKKRREQLAHEREESQALMSSIEDGVVNVGPDGRLLHFNSGFASHFLTRDQMAQASEQNVLITQTLRDTEVLSLFDRALRNGEGGNLQRAISTLVGGGLRFFSITISPLRDPKTKEIYAALGLFHDITDLKRTEKIRMDFVANASHELRTPLTTVKGYLETFKEDFQKGDTTQADFFLSTISKNVNRLVDLVNDLLTISSLEQGVSPELEEVEVIDITTDVIERFSTLAKEKNVTLSCIAEEVRHIRADSSKLVQVLENLVGNAIKYGKAGGQVQVAWQYEQVESESSKMRFIKLSVKDDGPGISKEHLPRLFERFYRVDKARSREVGGTGLGLAIVKHIVQSHGGMVNVHSEEGKGTEFTCYFPVRELT